MSALAEQLRACPLHNVTGAMLDEVADRIEGLDAMLEEGANRIEELETTNATLRAELEAAVALIAAAHVAFVTGEMKESD